MKVDNVQLMAIILQILGVDGKLTEEEIEAVEKEAIFLQIDDRTFKKVIAYINKIKNPADIIKGIDSFEEKVFTMQEIYRVLYLKKNVSKLERKAAEWIRDSLNLSKQLAKRLENIIKRIQKLSDELDAIYNQCAK